jgi:UDP-N-acetyl-D-galactosamine dehydrogenase
MNLDNKKIAVIGLGYVGLPLAVEFGCKYRTVGFDINSSRVADLRKGIDFTLEIEQDRLLDVLGKKLFVISDSVEDLKDCNIFIITVPTPTDNHNIPDLTPLIKASESIGKVLKKGDIVIYESTVYPGATEDDCVPVLERISGLKYNIDFFAGYSPERINPGDKEHTVVNILKLTSGSNPETADVVDKLYQSIIIAGTHKASSIRVAEAAKVIENSQRDINIAFVNELAKIFSALNLDTHEVLEAASTKWNFLKFKPGLVGGHCIGVDPYYLAQKAQEVGYHPEIILSGRRINDSMGKYVATEVIKLMVRKELKVLGANVLILGFTFKENCPDVRNTRVIDIYSELKSYKMIVDVYDPWASFDEVKREYGIEMLKGEQILDLEKYQAIIVAVGHNEFISFPIRTSPTQVIYDVKGCLQRELVDSRL